MRKNHVSLLLGICCLFLAAGLASVAFTNDMPWWGDLLCIGAMLGGSVLLVRLERKSDD